MGSLNETEAAERIGQDIDLKAKSPRSERSAAW